ncbi:histidine phosphatase family protein [Actinophytocola xinjiangensis]|uniref:Histidine phosphatase family protein n=1 Tax=Actinophytocola xinjiangensis TaxID=485602 RepID=A0A7Z0WL10_9PSEU|nr:histidine phosphatase family protein [Actinophytocola xinjiangensis]OLF09827.1 histidine phosphatase family protein [Actinophytocola xinjiangensis]
MPATRYLYLTRHAEATPDETTLTDAGRRQATLLAERLAGTEFDAVHHGPLARAAETAAILAARTGAPPHRTELAGDYVPHVPGRADLPAGSADAYLGFLDQFPEADRDNGARLAAGAVAEFTGPCAGDRPRRDLVVTHLYLIGWLVRASQETPPWRWLSVQHCNAALTVIRYAPHRPPTLVMYNEMSHLPPELRWTGFPPENRI